MKRRLHAAGVCLVLGACLGRPAAAQEISPPALKAAFVAKFAKFTDWPQPVGAGAPFRFCVMGSADVSHALTDVLASTRHRDLQVATLDFSAARDLPQLRQCHVLYLSGRDRNRVVAVLNVVRDEPILTVSDLSGFATIGGIAEIYMQDDRMRFAINLRSAQQARLKLSASMLSLATIVDGDRP